MANTLPPSPSVPMTLNPSQLKQWFATIERDNEPHTTKTDSYLAAQFLARFGLKEATQVVEFLKTAGGNETINMIAQELMKEEEQIQFIRENNAEEMLRQQRLLFLLMTLIVKNKAQAQHVNEVSQQQIEQKLKEIKTERKKDTVSMHMVDAYHRAEKMQSLDKELKKLEEDLTQVEEELNALEEEMLLMEENNALITDHLDQLNTILQAPLFNNQPMTHYMAHANQQIASITAQLAALRAQTPTSGNVGRVQEIESRTSRKIRMLEEQLAFHNAQLQQPPQTPEQIFQQLIERVSARLGEQEHLNEEIQLSTHREPEVEGLKLQKLGLVQALQFLRKEKILLNSQLEPVNDFSQAQFIIDPSHRARYRRHGDSYAIFSEDMNPDHLSENDWLQAKLNYDRLKSDICTVHSLYNERVQQQTEKLRERTQHCQSRAQELLSRIDKVQVNKVQLLQEPSPFVMSPKPKPKPSPKLEPKSSYSLMMRNLECLVPTHAPAPRSVDILNAKSALEAVVSPDHKDELQELIGEVKPGQIMAPGERLGWLYRVKKLIPDLPVPELDSSSKYQKK